MALFKGLLIRLFHCISPTNINICSCEYMEIQAQLTAVLGLNRSSLRVPLSAIASFSANPNIQMAYQQACKDLYQIGVTKATIRQNGDKILEILSSQGMVAGSSSNTGDQGQFPSHSLYICLATKITNR